MASFQPNAFQPNAFQEGKAQSGAENYTITANSGTYSLTGQIATILKSRIVSAANGTYSLSGQAATVLRSKIVTAGNGTYQLTGQVAGVFKSNVISANNGTYALTGKDAAITYGVNYAITAEAGSYSVTGQGALLDYAGSDQQIGGQNSYRVSPAYAKKLIEAKLRSIAKHEVKAKKKTKEPAQEIIHAAVAIDDIAKQSKEIAKLEQEALVNLAVQEVVSMQSKLDAEIKAEFAAMQIAAQLAIFEEEIVFMFMTATEA